jgi:uncharacterized protein (DUF486 family)
LLPLIHPLAVYRPPPITMAGSRTIFLLSLSSVFMTFAVLYMGQKLTWNYAAAGLCLAGAAFFMFYFKPAA